MNTTHTLQSPHFQRPTWLGRGVRESLRMALDSLQANKLRTILTMLGIVIGVASVVALVAIGNGATASVTERIASIGSNLLTVSPGQSSGGGGPTRSQSQTLTMADAESISELPGITATAPAYQSNAQLVSSLSNSNATVVGTVPSYFTIKNLTIEQGSSFTAEQVEKSRSVVVIGSGVAEDLFSGQDAVGKSLRIAGYSFQVVGVLEEQGGDTRGSVDDQVFIPISVAQLKLFGARASGSASLLVSNISVQVTDVDQMDAVSTLISATLRHRHKLSSDGSEDDFNVFNQADLLETLSETTSILTAFLGAIAGISLLVGGIGVMNIMLVSVTERTKEIGLRKAVGARRSDILQQFLIEAVLVSVIGGVIGVIIGIAIASLINLTGLMTSVVTLPSVFLALGFSMLVGLFFGIYPAQRAAKLRPIEALRYE
ncbi:MAG: ABC transporter permease [Roseiflexaceae bacterium]